MTFWYHMYGVDIGELFVSKTGLDGGAQTLIWFLAGQQSVNSTDWKYGQVGVADANPFQVLGAVLNSRGTLLFLVSELYSKIYQVSH